MKKYYLFGTFLFLFLTFQVFAQNPTPTPNQTTEADEKNSDLVITATVKAEELKFEIVPNPKVEFTSNKNTQTVSEADRENLPSEVQPGVTYRNIGIRLRIYSRFTEIQRIVIEMLDEEKPPSDGTTQNQLNNTEKKPN